MSEKTTYLIRGIKGPQAWLSAWLIGLQPEKMDASSAIVRIPPAAVPALRAWCHENKAYALELAHLINNMPPFDEDQHREKALLESLLERPLFAQHEPEQYVSFEINQRIDGQHNTEYGVVTYSPESGAFEFDLTLKVSNAKRMIIFLEDMFV